MKISAYTALSTIDLVNAKTDAKKASSNGITAAEPVSIDSTNKAAQIMQKYNLHNISYSEVTNLAMDLQKTGAIPGGNLLDYLPPPEGQFKMQNGTLVSDNHGKGDFIKALDDHLAYVEKNQASDFSTLFQVRRMVNFYHNLDSLGSGRQA
jgi:hypothetical protein